MGRRPMLNSRFRATNSRHLLLLVPVDDVEEISSGVQSRQLLQRVERPKRHGLLVTLAKEGEFAFVGEVVLGVWGD